MTAPTKSSSDRRPNALILGSPRDAHADQADAKAAPGSEAGFFRKLIGGSAASSPKDSEAAALKKQKDKRSGAESPGKLSAGKKVMDLLGPLLLSKGRALRASKPPSGTGSALTPPSPTASAAVGQVDAPKLMLPRAMSASSGLTDYVNKMQISDTLGSKRSKQSTATDQQAAPIAAAALLSAAAPQQPPAAAKAPQTPLDRLLEQARHCNLPVSPRGPETVCPPAPGAPPVPPSPAASTFGGVPHPTVMLSISATIPPKMQRAKWCLDDYVIMEKLYTGYASTVFKATCLRSGDVVVLKIYTLSAVCDLYKYQIYREVRVHSNLLHENVVHLYAAFQQGEKVIMVQEYADGSDLFTLLHKYGGRLSERLAVQMVLDPFLRVLQYLHTRGIIHRDIKPENIMFTKNMCLKLGDFGLAIDLREERAVTRAGTLDYMAPEVLRCPFKSRPTENKDNTRLHYSNRVDTWAVGVLTYELMVGFPPFFDQSRTGTEDRILTSQAVFPANMSEDAKAFVMSSLAKSPADRPTILELLGSTWVDSYRTRRSMRSIPSTAASAAAPLAGHRSALASVTAMAAPLPRGAGVPLPLPPALSSILSNISDGARVGAAAKGVTASPGKPLSATKHAAAPLQQQHPKAISPTSTLMRHDSVGSTDDASVYMHTSLPTAEWVDPGSKAASAARHAPAAHSTARVFMA